MQCSSGRARRKEYWFFVLFNIIISIVLAVIDGVTGSFSPEAGMGLLGGIYTLAVLIPGIAVSVRRLHDTERSGWWLLIALVPLIGAIVLTGVHGSRQQARAEPIRCKSKRSDRLTNKDRSCEATI
jgi:uncharacterized membrane protein YhaH (DUF805 family)